MPTNVDRNYRQQVEETSSALPDLPETVESHIEHERARYDAQFGKRRENENLLVKYGTEFAPNDLRAAMLYSFDQLGDLRGKRVLEIGGGTGWHAIMLIHRGAYVVTTDVSPVGVEVARERLIVNGMEQQGEAEVVAAEKMPFENESFDAVYGVAVLHHLDLPHAIPAIHRVLKPGGRAVFLEPLSENPLLDFVRDYVPYPSKKSPFGHRGLKHATIDEAARSFRLTETRRFYLTSMANRLISQQTSITPLEKLDELLIARFPKLHRYCRTAVVTFEK